MVSIKRSEAARRGWITRRKNQAKKANAKAEAKAEKFSPVKEKIIEPDLAKAMVKDWFDDKSLSEIYSSGLQFAMVSKDWEQCHSFAYCKDFLQDAVWAELNKKRASIYQFIHEYGKNPPVDLEKTRVALRYKGKKGIQTTCKKSLAFLHAMEKDMNFEPSVLYFGGKYKETPSSVYIFESDVRWQYSPTMLSLYTLSLRVGLTYEGGPWRTHFEGAKSYLNNNDKDYTNRAKSGLDKIIGKKVENIFAPTMASNYPSDASIHGIHGNSGIAAFGDGDIDKSVKKYWGQHN